MTAPSKSLPLPPMNAVRAFEAAARRCSFKEAAAELGVTHGAVSRQIRLLEDWLGRPSLFRRLSHGVALTAEGTAFLAEIGPALERIATAGVRHGQPAKPSTTVLRVHALATFSLRWLVPKLPLLRDAHPDIELRLTTGNEPVDALAGDYDLVIRGGPDTFHGFEARHLLPERRLPVCSPQLAEDLPPDRIADLERQTLIEVASMPRLWRDWLAMAGQGGLVPCRDPHARPLLSRDPGRDRWHGRGDGPRHPDRGRSSARSADRPFPGLEPARSQLFRLRPDRGPGPGRHPADL